MKLANFVDYHRGKTMHIFGKGKSLDNAKSRDFSGIGHLRLCINESVLMVRWPTYFMACDGGPIRNVAGYLPQRCTPVLYEAMAKIAIRECGMHGVAIYDDYLPYETAKRMSKDDVAHLNALCRAVGTLNPAVHFSWLCGCKHIVLVGFDGLGGLAKCLLDWGFSNCERDYRKNNESAYALMHALGITYEHWGV